MTLTGYDWLRSRKQKTKAELSDGDWRENYLYIQYISFMVKQKVPQVTPKQAQGKQDLHPPMMLQHAAWGSMYHNRNSRSKQVGARVLITLLLICSVWSLGYESSHPNFGSGGHSGHTPPSIPPLQPRNPTPPIGPKLPLLVKMTKS